MFLITNAALYGQALNTHLIWHQEPIHTFESHAHLVIMADTFAHQKQNNIFERLKVLNVSVCAHHTTFRVHDYDNVKQLMQASTLPYTDDPTLEYGKNIVELASLVYALKTTQKEIHNDAQWVIVLQQQAYPRDAFKQESELIMDDYEDETSLVWLDSRGYSTYMMMGTYEGYMVGLMIHESSIQDVLDVLNPNGEIFREYRAEHGNTMPLANLLLAHACNTEQLACTALPIVDHYTDYDL
ncbi:MAG: hypothetical protein ACTSUE_27020 [Promethearchaeota archaeon]